MPFLSHFLDFSSAYFRIICNEVSDHLKEYTVKKFGFFLLPFLVLTTLHAEEPATKTTPSQTFSNGIAVAKYLANEYKHPLKIAGNTAKIVAAAVTLQGYYAFLTTIGAYMKRQEGFPYNPGQKKYDTSLMQLWVHQHLQWTNNDGSISGTESQEPIARPPYFSALIISAYLLGSGSYGLYKEIS